ncbi:MAG: hydrogenase subunit MbhD domain-containing protein [Candidatus Promineifilaceae bacterium]
MFAAVNLVLLLGLVVSAVLVVTIRGVVNAIIAFSALGAFLTLLFFLFQAPDVALSEAAVGTVATPLVLLIALAKIRGLLDDPAEAE